MVSCTVTLSPTLTDSSSMLLSLSLLPLRERLRSGPRGVPGGEQLSFGRASEHEDAGDRAGAAEEDAEEEERRRRRRKRRA